MKIMILRIKAKDINGFLNGKRVDFISNKFPSIEPVTTVLLYCEKKGKTVYLDDTKTALNGKICGRGVYASARMFFPNEFSEDDGFWSWLGVPKKEVIEIAGNEAKLLRINIVETFKIPLDLKDFGINKMNNDRRYVVFGGLENEIH